MMFVILRGTVAKSESDYGFVRRNRIPITESLLDTFERPMNFVKHPAPDP